MKKISFLVMVLGAFLNAEVNLYGPGGPHTALKEVAKVYEQKTGVKVNVNFGPQKTWQEKAEGNADILFGASDQSAVAIATDFGDKFDPKEIKPLYLREAIILAQKGNPLKIKGLRDLANKKAKIVVPEGAGKSNTSGTGVWEDMIGRTKDLKTIADFRANIVAYVPNSGSAKKLFLNKDADVWITWIDWAKSNPDFGEIVKIEKDLVVYRTFNVVASKNASKETMDFIAFLSSKDAEKIFNKFGWSK